MGKTLTLLEKINKFHLFDDWFLIASAIFLAVSFLLYFVVGFRTKSKKELKENAGDLMLGIPIFQAIDTLTAIMYVGFIDGLKRKGDALSEAFMLTLFVGFVTMIVPASILIFYGINFLFIKLGFVTKNLISWIFKETVLFTKFFASKIL